jgi:copper(I)-binding protein
MFTSLKQPLDAGKKVKGSLTFEKAGKVDVDFAVEKMGASPGGEHSGHMNH